MVKVIGDEVMFVTPDSYGAATLACELVGACAVEEVVPDVRIGLAHGTALPMEGDFFGPTVNVAGRLVELPRPASVLCSDTFIAAPRGGPGSSGSPGSSGRRCGPRGSRE